MASAGPFAAVSNDTRDGELVVHGMTKSRRMRRVPVPPQLAAEIRGHVGTLVPFDERKGVWVFNRTVRRLSGVSSFSAHACRHTFGFNCMARGGNLLALQVMMGHSAVGVYYARPTQELVRADAERVHRVAR